MPISRKDVEHVARLARLALSEEEITSFEEQLARILEHAERVTSLDTEGVPPTSHAIAQANVFREDVVGECLPQDAALANAPQAESNQFRVPRIIEDES
jgi:aspartyl-tRNA(Asn)/glutamyl-tRNA(Gln) amidotransferase subunit C